MFSFIANCFRIAKITHTGIIEVGKRADLLLFNEDLSLLKTVVSGQIVFQIENE